MRVLSKFVGVLAAGAFAIAQATSPNVQIGELEPYELPTDVAARVLESTGSDALRLITALGDPSPASREAAMRHWDALEVRERCAIVRFGLRVGGAAAVGAAAMACEGDWLDIAETKAAVRAGMATCNLVDTPFDLGEFFRMFDGEDAARLLTDPGPRPRELPQFLGPVHRTLGPEHHAQIEQLALGDDFLLRVEASRYLWVRPATLQRLANYLVTRPDDWDEPPAGFDPTERAVPYTPLAAPPRRARDGYSSLLAVLLERSFLSARGVDRHAAFVAFRMAREARARADDFDLLLRLAASGDDVARRVAVQGLLEIGDHGSVAALREIAADTESTEIAPILALAALARSGDVDAARRLADPTAPELALALAWQVARDAAEAALDAAFVADPEAASVPFARLLAAIERGASIGEPMIGIENAIVARARRQSLDTARLFTLLRELPATRHADLCRSAIDLVEADSLEAAPLDVLEVVDATALALRLRVVLEAAEADSAAGLFALSTLAMLEPALQSEPSVVHRLLDTAAGRGDPEFRARLFVDLVAARRDVLRERVLAEVRRPDASAVFGEVGAVAVALAATGVDRLLAHSFLSAYLGEEGAERFDAARAALSPALQRGDGIGAVVALLEEATRAGDLPWTLFSVQGLWTLADGAALPFLREARDRRELGKHREAVGQLARTGDPEALAVVERAITKRLYGWLDDWPPHVLANGHDLSRVSLLLRQIDANCCTHTVIGAALDEILPRPREFSDDVAVTRDERARALWSTPPERLRFSRIADSFVVVP